MNPSTWWTLKSAITCCRVRCLRGPGRALAMSHPDEPELRRTSLLILPVGGDLDQALHRGGDALIRVEHRRASHEHPSPRLDRRSDRVTVYTAVALTVYAR